MGKYLRISSYIRKPFLIYDFATAPLWISLYKRKIWIPFLSVYVILWYSFIHGIGQIGLAASKGLAGTSRSQDVKGSDVRRQEGAVPVRVYNSRGCAVTGGGGEAGNRGCKCRGQEISVYGWIASKGGQTELQRRRFSGFFPLVLKMLQKGVKKWYIQHMDSFVQRI